MKKSEYKSFKIVSDNQGNRFIYIVANGNEMPVSYDGLIPLPKSFTITLYVEPILKQLKKLGFKVRGDRYLSQKTGEMQTDLFIAI
jgi:hypothetical protein